MASHKVPGICVAPVTDQKRRRLRNVLGFAPQRRRRGERLRVSLFPGARRHRLRRGQCLPRALLLFQPAERRWLVRVIRLLHPRPRLCRRLHAGVVKLARRRQLRSCRDAARRIGATSDSRVAITEGQRARRACRSYDAAASKRWGVILRVHFGNKLRVGSVSQKLRGFKLSDWLRICRFFLTRCVGRARCLQGSSGRPRCSPKTYRNPTRRLLR